MITTRLLSVFTFTVVKFVFFFYLCSSINLLAQNWPMANCNRERTSWAQYETVLKPPLEKTMEFSLFGGYQSGMSFYNGMLFVSIELDFNRFVAFNYNDTTKVWHFDIPNSEGSVNVVPAVNDTLVLCGGQNGLGLYALDKLTGVEKWFNGLGSLYSANPIIDSSRIYIVRDTILCLNIHNGSVIWSKSFPRRATPAVDDKQIYVCGDRRLIAFDKFTGDIKWQIYNSQRSYASIAVDNNFLYTYSNDSILAITKDSGKVHWVSPNTYGTVSDLSNGAIAISDSFLCYAIWENADNKGQLHTIDKITGSHLWQYTFDTTGTFTPMIANGTVYIVQWVTASVWGFDLRTGDIVFYDNSEQYLGQPIAANNTLYVGALGKVTAFNNLSTDINFSFVEKQKLFKLFPNYPNPFNPSTTISFFLPHDDFVKLAVYNIQGEEVEVLINNELPAGLHKTLLNASTLASGVYFYKITASNFNRTKKIALIK
ncbi:MAG: PQQ-binding-like beta-propeller repeat protein [Ignavibacteriaceae bacterium]|nr:PQQ-binding-like beta-propeller repeat protein [Ignavibacteriaceae bacterium]